jgi:hypothetical protein
MASRSGITVLVTAIPLSLQISCTERPAAVDIRIRLGTTTQREPLSRSIVRPSRVNSTALAPIGMTIRSATAAPWSIASAEFGGVSTMTSP